MCFLCISGFAGLAQETTATFGGTIGTGKNEQIQGAIVTLKHEPTGYVSTTQTNNKGIFTLPNLKPGGPYPLPLHMWDLNHMN